MDGFAGEPHELARSGGGDDEFAPRQRRWVRPVAWVAVVALVLGGAFSSALTLLGGPSSSRHPAKGTVVSEVIEERGMGSGTVAIETPPEGATALAVRFTCLTQGAFTWGIDPVKNPGSSCGAESVGSAVWNEFDLPDLPQLYITADQDAEWAVQVMYVGSAQGHGV